MCLQVFSSSFDWNVTECDRSRAGKRKITKRLNGTMTSRMCLDEIQSDFSSFSKRSIDWTVGRLVDKLCRASKNQLARHSTYTNIEIDLSLFPYNGMNGPHVQINQNVYFRHLNKHEIIQIDDNRKSKWKHDWSKSFVKLELISLVFRYLFPPSLFILFHCEPRLWL